MAAADFPSRLLLALKALSLSRGRLAAELAVDKSVISRWLSGHQAPTGENLARLTALVATRRPGFTLLDWEAEPEALSAKLGIDPGSAAGWGPTSAWLPEPILQESRAITDLRGEAYEGIWRSTRLAIGQPGRFVHDYVLIRRAENGFLTTRTLVEDMRFDGWIFLTQTQLFTVSADARSGMFLLSIFNAVLRSRAERLDGIALTIQRVGGGSPVAGAVLMERFRDLTGDVAADDEIQRELSTGDPLAPEGSVPDDVRDHLFRDVGPEAFARGGMALLTMPFETSWSRGTLF